MRKRELVLELQRARERNNELELRVAEARYHAEQERRRCEGAIAEERKLCLEKIEAQSRRHDVRVDSLLGFITSPENAQLYARARELELESDLVGRPPPRGPDEELTLGQLKARDAGEELVRRGITQEEIEAAAANP